MDNSSKSTFGKYQILERIATGGMAEIYRAQLHGIAGFQRQLAIKIILPSLSANQDYVQMLADEARVAGLLSHANIVQIHDLGEQDGNWFIAMELVEGYDLSQMLRRMREKNIILPIPHAVFIATEILKGLEYAHAQTVSTNGVEEPLNIVHRDISPSNILISDQGEVKLTDFGIARASLKVLETLSGVLKGKFDYMSPEQAGNLAVDQRSDLFSMGTVLYQMLTGAHPFRADNELATVNRIRTGRYTPASQRNGDIPVELEVILNKALSPTATDRFSNATEFKTALETFFHQSGFILAQQNLSNYIKDLYPELRQSKIPVVAAPTPVPSLQRPKITKSARQSPSSPLQTNLDQDHTDESDLVTLVQESPMATDQVLPIFSAEKFEPDPSSWPTGFKGAALALSLLSIGSLAGAITGLLLSFMFFPRVPLTPPILSIDAPPQTAILLDGDAVSNEVKLSSGQTHNIEITTKGFEPWHTQILAEQGKVYTIIISRPSVTIEQKKK